MASHHPNSDLLMSYGAGALGESWSLALATHLTLCPSCRSIVDTVEEFGGALLEDLEPDSMSVEGLESIMAKLDEPSKPAEFNPSVPAQTILPRPLRDYVGDDVDAVQWKSIGGGVCHFTVLANDSGQVHLLKIPVGRPVPEHGHNGREMTLVLAGSFKDEFGSFSRGDVQDVDQDTVHQPVAGMVEDCICLAVTDAPLDFKSILPRLAQPFIRRFLNVNL